MKKLFYLLLFVSAFCSFKSTIPFQADVLEVKIRCNDVSGVLVELNQFAWQPKSVRTEFVALSDSLLTKPQRRLTFDELVKLAENPLEMRENLVRNLSIGRKPDVEDRLINKLLRAPSYPIHLFALTLEDDERKRLESCFAKPPTTD